MTPTLFRHVQAYHQSATFNRPVPADLDFACAPADLVREARGELARLSGERALFGRDHERKSQHAALTAMVARATSAAREAQKENANAE